jgi:hypothetical protein
MATNTAPSPSFSGIDFNPNFFNSSTGLTLSQADSLYLNKSVEDTANVLETFTVGIVANALQATTASITTLSTNSLISDFISATTFFTAFLNVNVIDSQAGPLTLGEANATSIVATQNITLNATSLPTVGQLGYTVDILNASTSTTSATISAITNISSTLIPIGTYIIHFEGQASLAGVYNIGISTSSTAFDTKHTIGATCASGFNQNFTHPEMSVIIQNTTPTTWYLNQSSTTASLPIIRIHWYYTKIA